MSSIFDNTDGVIPTSRHLPALSTVNSATAQKGGCITPTVRLSVSLTEGLPSSSQLHKKESPKDQPETVKQIPDNPPTSPHRWASMRQSWGSASPDPGSGASAQGWEPRGRGLLAFWASIH